MIPDGWKVGKIKDLIKSLDAGVSINSENKSIQNAEIGVLKVSAVSYGKFLPSEHKVALAEEIHRLTIYPKKDRILISRANTPDLVGASVYIDRDYPNLFLPDKLWQTEPRHNNFSIRWLSYLISSDDYRLKISSHATGTSMSMKNISKVDLLNIEIIIPPLSEQCKIAEILGVWDEAIDLLEKLIGKARSRKQGLMQQLLTGKKRFKEFEGSEWKTVKLGQISKTSSGGTPPSNNLSFYGGDIPWISISDMTSAGKYLSDTERKLTELGLQNSSAKIFPVGTILFAMYASIGKCSIAKVMASCSQAILGIQINESIVDMEFIYYFLASQEAKYGLMGQQGTQKNLNAGMVRDFNVPIPPLPEQEKIAVVLSAADEEISTLEKQLAAYKQQKLGLMQQLLTGRTRI